MSTKAPEELRQTIAHELRNAANAPDFQAADIALRLIEAKYGPACWRMLERTKKPQVADPVRGGTYYGPVDDAEWDAYRKGNR